MKAVYVSLCVDDLDARSDPSRSDRLATYKCTPDEIKQVLDLIKVLKVRESVQIDTVGVPIDGRILEIRK